MLETKNLIIILLFFSLNSFAKQAPLKEVSQRDSRKVQSFFKYLERGIFKQNLGRKVLKILHREGTSFKNETYILNTLNAVSKRGFIVSSCQLEKDKLSTDVAKYLGFLVQKICHNKLVKRKNERRLTKKEKLFLTQYYSDLVENGYLGILNLRKVDSVYPGILAEVLSLQNFDIDEITDLFQRTYAGKHIFYDQTLTNHLQKIGIFPSKESKLFKKEFRILCKKAMNEESKIVRDHLLEQVLSFYKENKKLIGYRYSNRKFRQISRRLYRSNKKLEAKRFISKAVSIQSDKNKAPLYFERLYLDLIDGDYKTALKYINRSGILGQENHFSSKLRFWLGRVFYQNNERPLAEFLFKSQVRKKPLNYYSVLSTAHLKEMGENKFIEKNYFFRSSVDLSNTLNQVSQGDLNLNRLRFWVKIDNNKLAKLEIKDMLKGRHPASSDNDVSKSLEILKVFQEEEDYLNSFKFFNRNSLFSSVDFLPSATKVLFPTPYIKKIRRKVKDLDPILILSLIRQESAFNPRAKSSAGARGLMQLMPATARMYKKRLRKSELYKPNLNLEIGTKYFRYLYKKYDQCLVRTLASYNAGETNLRRWEGKYFTSEDELLRVESIPFNETENYVKYITRNIFFYRMIFGEPIFKGLDWVKKSI